MRIVPPQTLINIDFYNIDAVSVKDLEAQLTAAVAELTSASARVPPSPQAHPNQQKREQSRSERGTEEARTP